MTKSKGGLYVHIPYCTTKCLYCDFYCGGARQADFRRLVRALSRECTERADELPDTVDTVYIGGGTPSLLPSSEFRSLVESLKNSVGDGRWKPVEFTVEANPDDVLPENVEAWKRAGVNRVSMGVQTFDDSLLAFLRRRHTAAESVRAYEILRGHFPNISIDLMFGIPSQTFDIWRDSVMKAIELRPEHISCYSLMYEPGTALTHLRDRGDIAETSDADTERMFSYMRDAMTDAGYEHYEISNFALPGFGSRHNGAYWKGLPYLGLGPSAHSYDGHSVRRANPADIRKYLECFAPLTESETPRMESFFTEERLTDEELREEMILTRLRTADGIDIDEYASRFGHEALGRLLANAKRDTACGRLERIGNALRLTPSGILTSDSVMVNLSM
ncbi:MAG: radical SAM family heme chaperone HemW [Muribaculaceae bacterium]|nr:radical SAM family heme chaperone HemW [Muribaculaceae bacterium]